MTDWIELGELADIRRGTTPAKPVDLDDGPGFIGLAEITRDGIIERQPEPGLPLDDAVHVQPGDIVVALMGKLGDCAVAREPAILGRECALVRVRADEQRIDPRWLHLAMRSHTLRENLQRHARGTTMPRLPIKAISALLIPTPPLSEQHATLERLDVIADATRAQAALLTALNDLYDTEIELVIAEHATPRNEPGANAP